MCIAWTSTSESCTSKYPGLWWISQIIAQNSNAPIAYTQAQGDMIKNDLKENCKDTSTVNIRKSDWEKIKNCVQI